ncbi:Zn(II)2Cys6 transcription factor [Aspergillus foveolatus]|uniref:Zn(II)2Cys6 transcription factor n=1 Tax=Aspergillus foveolatus TaxID=210207 RepID=UPI003CCD7E54
MTTASQPIRGCFQCTKRRIVCDRGEPICRKCQKKGIECSGLGRFRFYSGSSIRGLSQGDPVPVTLPDQLQKPQRDCTGKQVPFNIRWKSDQPSKRTGRKRSICAIGTTAERNLEYSQKGHIVADERHSGECDSIPSLASDISLAASTFDALWGVPDIGPDYVKKVSCNDEAAQASISSTIAPWIPLLNSQTRMFLSHFADEVAPNMVVLDKISNGYREILLPLACHDELLQQSVCAVAAQHLALRQASFRRIAESSRAAIISRLRRDAFQEPTERLFSAFTWATLIVLLVGETITASPEYTHLLQMLFCMAGNTSDMAMSPINQFLTQQTHMFEFLGQPFLGENQGLDMLRRPLNVFLDWTYYDLPPESTYTQSLGFIRESFIKASQIYIGRATNNEDQWMHLEALKQLVSCIHPDEQGSHALVWVCFIGAADSTTPDHRQFFTSRMEGVFRKTGFQNVAAAIQSLPAIWSQKELGRWTSSLIRTLPALIM